MGRLELAVEQGETAGLQSRDEPGERHLRCIGPAADHRFAEKSAAQCQAVQATDQIVAVPAFDRMRIAHAVQRHEHLFDATVDPGFRAIVGAFGAQLDHAFERSVGGDAKAATRDRLAQRRGEVEAVDRQDRAGTRFDPIDAVGVAVIRHREDAHRIGAEHEFRVERLHRRPRWRWRGGMARWRGPDRTSTSGGCV